MKRLKFSGQDMTQLIIAYETDRSWRSVVPAVCIYRADVTGLLTSLRAINAERTPLEAISLNTLFIRLTAAGLQAAPKLNARFQYWRKAIRQKIEPLRQIDISTVMMTPEGKSFALTLRDMQDKTLSEIAQKICDIKRRLANTELIPLLRKRCDSDTMERLKKGELFTFLARMDWEEFRNFLRDRLFTRKKEACADADCLTEEDFREGTVLLSNPGGNRPDLANDCTLTEILPGTVAGFCFNAIRDEPVVVQAADGIKSVEVRSVMPLTILFDHRAADYADVIPFLDVVKDVCEHPGKIHDWE